MTADYYHDGNIVGIRYRGSKNGLKLIVDLMLYAEPSGKSRIARRYVFDRVSRFNYNCDPIEYGRNYSFGVIADGELIRGHPCDEFRLTLVGDGAVSVLGHLVAVE